MALTLLPGLNCSEVCFKDFFPLLAVWEGLTCRGLAPFTTTLGIWQILLFTVSANHRWCEVFYLDLSDHRLRWKLLRLFQTWRKR